MQVRQLIAVTAVLVLFLPIRWWDNILRLVLCLAVKITLVTPRSSLHSHGVVLATGIRTARGVGECQLAERVVEHGVGDETAGVVRLACLGVYVQRRAVARAEVAGTTRITLELLDIDGFDVAAVVLVEVREAVVEEDRRLDVFRDVEAEDAHVCLLHDAGFEGVVLASPTPHGLGVFLGSEGRGHSAAGYRFERVFGVRIEVYGNFGRGRVAVCIVD